MSTEESETEMPCSPPEIKNVTKIVSSNLLPEKSKKNYAIVYNSFIEWQLKNNTSSYSEDTVLAYFKEISAKFKSSTLWTHYSMLKNTLKLKHNVNIEPYGRVRALLKRKAEGYIPKKSEVFTAEQINTFINEAPDVKYLATKVSLIMSIMGACRSNELYAMKVGDLKFFDGCIEVFVPYTKTKVSRNFSITGNFYDIVKKYADLRVLDTPSDSFFVNYQRGKCTKQIIGINKFGGMSKEIAKYLGLPNLEKFTGHCLRRSSATLHADAGVSMTGLKGHGGWKLPSVAEGYIADLKRNKMDTADKIMNQIDPDLINNRFTFPNACSSININDSSTILHDNSPIINNSGTNLKFSSGPTTVNFTNCNNLTINFVNK